VRANSGKRLMAFIVEGDLTKRRMVVEGGIIELLANGQQFVASGTHPSGARYEWQGGLPSSLPVLTINQLDAAWDGLAALFATEPPVIDLASRRKDGATALVDDPVADYLYAQGLVLSERAGKLFIDCPWASEHSHDVGDESSTTWLVAGSRGYERGHFECRHAHCVGRTDSAFKAAVGFDETGFEPVVLDTPSTPRAASLATPWRYIDPATIPPRRWLYGHHYIRQFLSTTVAPGGSGKSALALLEAMAIASNKPLLGVQPVERGKVWYFNGEDPLEETERRIAAACLHYGLRGEDLEGWLFIGSGRDSDLVVATQDRQGVHIHDPMVGQVTSLIRELDISLAIIDPFVSSHRVTENDNGAIDQVAKRWGRIADSTGCAVELVHHVRKGQAGIATTVEDGRGASALLAAARSARVLNAMTPSEADRAKVSSPRSYFRVTNGKANLAPPADASDWYRFTSIELGNGELGGGDNVGVVTKWEWPADAEAVEEGPLFVVPEEDIVRVQAALRAQPERGVKDSQSDASLVWLAAEVLGIVLDTERAISYMEGLINEWTNAGYFTRKPVRTRQRKWRDGYEVPSAPP
jgi:hypothetical protein